MSDSREEILARLRAGAGAPPPEQPHPWRTRRAFADLAGRFTKALTAAKGEVRRVADLPAALAEVARLLAELGVDSVIANRAPAPLDQVDWRRRFPAYAWHLVGEEPARLRALAATAGAGISSADAALAETGTLVVSSGPQRSRLATLLPPVHIALLPAERLTADLFTWVAARGGEPLPANLVLVSGPSKTADIEQTLAIGVHGPKRLIVLLY